MALSCNLTKNILKANSCEYTLNEIKDIYLIDYNSISGNGADYSCESGVTISAITPTSGAKFAHIEVAKNSATYTDELVVQDSGAKYRTHTLTFGLPGSYDKDKVCSVDALSLGRFIAVVRTASGQYLELGRNAGLEASEGSITGSSDNNSITITLTANTAETAYPLGETAVTELLSNVLA